MISYCYANYPGHRQRPRHPTGLLSYLNNISAHWVQYLHSWYLITAVLNQSVTFITIEPFNFSPYTVFYCYINTIVYREPTNPHWRKIILEYYLLDTPDADFKSYLEMSYNCSPYVSYSIVLHFIMPDPYKCTYPNSHRRNACYMFNIPYVVGADYKSYLGTFCDCSFNVPYYNILHFIICKLYKNPTKMYTYNVMMYFSECLNIFITIFNLGYQTMLIKLITFPCNILHSWIILS